MVGRGLLPIFMAIMPQLEDGSLAAGITMPVLSICPDIFSVSGLKAPIDLILHCEGARFGLVLSLTFAWEHEPDVMKERLFATSSSRSGSKWNSRHPARIEIVCGLSGSRTIVGR
jgi:hypothetical protein